MILMMVALLYENMGRVCDSIITLSFPEEWGCLEFLQVRTHGNRERTSQQLVFCGSFVYSIIIYGRVFNKEQEQEQLESQTEQGNYLSYIQIFLTATNKYLCNGFPMTPLIFLEVEEVVAFSYKK